MTKAQAIGHVERVHKKVITPFADLLLGRIMSKKLTVFLIATIFALKLILTGPEWVEVAKWYFMSQGAVDVAGVIMKTKKAHDINPGNEDN